MTGQSSSALHRPVPVHDLPAAGRPFQLVASFEECQQIARQFDLIAVERLAAEGTLSPEAGGRRVRLSGRLVADVVQTCVVSLDSVPAHIDAPFTRLYGWDAGEEWEEGAGEEVFLDLAGELPAEPLDGDVLDLGEVAVEQLALELDPYPRKPGALFTGCDVGGDAAADPSTSPFAGLARRLKQGGSGNGG